ncbi:aromatic amino acid aminotransferase [Cercophora scortea]|uniref:Aromatic amino acid aminotransferase n=1 Tax=Cercophora scortea TaxID=314031 RepID=A0AAE0IN99_9PEZI|nr:aromatic amino acid aminotransferase [Cercophora scortea]
MDGRSYHDEARVAADANADGSRGATVSEDKPLPVDLSHHYSEVTRSRLASKIKEYYKLFQIPGIANLAGGLPNVRFFPFDTLEAQTAKPERWTPTPNYPDEYPLSSAATGEAPPPVDDPAAPARILVPKEITDETDLLKKIDLATALQYGMSEGYPPLLSWVRQFTREHLHPNVPYRNGPDVILTCGSTDGFSKTLDLLVDSWSEGISDIRDRPGLLCETFIYGSILTQSLPRGVQVSPVKADEFGMLATGEGGLEDVLENWDPAKGRRPHLMYTVTLGHNPTGIVLSIERKKQIYAICSKYDVIIVEDEPYWYLQFPSAAVEEAKSRDEPVPDLPDAYKPAISSGYPFLDSLTPSFLTVDTDGRVIRLDTFSKTVAPGCRLGWITAQPAFIERLTRITECSTQQPSGFVQSMISELVLGAQPAAVKSSFLSLRTSRERAAFTGWQMGGWVRWLEGLRGMYERRMNRMCRLLDAGSFQLKTGTPLRSADSDWGVVTKTQLFSYRWPRGGMFVWIKMHFETHPLWQAPGTSGAPIDGPALSIALLMFLTARPHLVLASVGAMFSSTDEIRDEVGWAYYRLCFAAVAEDVIDASSKRFTDGIHKFWRIKDVKEIERLIKPPGADEVDVDALSEEMAQLGTWMGC